jgi:hypothetical protein
MLNNIDHRLQRHITGVHLKANSRQCPTCDKVLSSEQGLKNHIREVHTNERKFQCLVCLQSFKRKDVLSRHQTNVHLNQAGHVTKKLVNTPEVTFVKVENILRNHQP